MSKAISYITGCGGNGLDWEIKTNNFDIEKNTGYFVDTSSNPITATLPLNANIGDEFYITDSVGSVSDSNYVVIDNNSHNIMGLNDALTMTERYMSLYLVYADATKGWVIADGKGCDDDSTGGEITVDTTIYLAPSAASQSPTGIPVGSDTTGDGSAVKPFFSIKKAMEYLEGFRIKVGAYVIIKGYPGKYYYNTTEHSTLVKHKDAKYIKLHYDMYEGSNYHETTITTDTVTVTNNSDHDLITFTVDDIGTGFYQIQAGDYIKIYSNIAYWGLREYAVWNGYYKVTSVDVPNNKITIEFKRYQISGSYNSGHDYLLPTTPLSNNKINVVKLSTTTCYSVLSNNDTFFKSNFGFGSIQINLCNDNNNFNGRGVEIYDGVIDDVYININGFGWGVHFENLKCNILDINNKFYSTYTSCQTGCHMTDTTFDMTGMIFNNCSSGLYAYTGCTMEILDNFKSSSCNNYYHGYNTYGSSMHIGSSYTQSNTLNAFYNDSGVAALFNANLAGVGYNCRYNSCGISLYASQLIFYGQANSSIVSSTLHYNTRGIRAQHNSYVDISYLYAYGNTIGIDSSSSTIESGSVGASLGSDSFHIYSSSSSNMICTGCSYIQLLKGDIASASSTNLNLTECPSVDIQDTNIRNGVYGIIGTKGTYIFYYTTSSSYNIHDNSSYNVDLYFGARMSSYVKAAIPTPITPTKNTAPSYSGSNGSWLLETVY